MCITEPFLLLSSCQDDLIIAKLSAAVRNQITGGQLNDDIAGNGLKSAKIAVWPGKIGLTALRAIAIIALVRLNTTHL